MVRFKHTNKQKTHKHTHTVYRSSMDGEYWVRVVKYKPTASMIITHTHTQTLSWTIIFMHKQMRILSTCSEIQTNCKYDYYTHTHTHSHIHMNNMHKQMLSYTYISSYSQFAFLFSLIFFYFLNLRIYIYLFTLPPPPPPQPPAPRPCICIFHYFPWFWIYIYSQLIINDFKNSRQLFINIRVFPSGCQCRKIYACPRRSNFQHSQLCGMLSIYSGTGGYHGCLRHHQVNFRLFFFSTAFKTNNISRRWHRFLTFILWILIALLWREFNPCEDMGLFISFAFLSRF